MSKIPKGVAEQRRKDVMEEFRGLGLNAYESIVQGKFPEVTLPSRSVNNLVYDDKLKQYILGNNSVTRSSRNVKHIRPYTQLLWLAFFANQLVQEERTSTLRDVFYSAQAFNMDFTDQSESDEIITDLETALSKAREDFNVYPDERSAIFGKMTIEYTKAGYEGKRQDLSSHPDGLMIGPALTTAEFVNTDAEMVIAIEKGGLFTRFVEEKVHDRFKALLINTAGQPPRSTRYLIRRLNQELGLPVYMLADADPWGAHICMVIKSGSVRADEPIAIRDDVGNVRLVKIGEFVDDCIADFGQYVDAFGNEVCGLVPFEVLTVDADNKVTFKAMSGAIRHRHRGVLYELTTAGGRTVTVTPNHSVFLLRDGRLESIPTSEIKVGDMLVTQSASPRSTPQNGLRASSAPEQNPLTISGEPSFEEFLATTQHGWTLVASQTPAAPGHHASPMAFPIVRSGLVNLKEEIRKHVGHDRRSRLVYRRICDAVRSGEDGGANPAYVSEVIQHMRSCSLSPPAGPGRRMAESLDLLLEGDASFDPVTAVRVTPYVDEFVYDVSVPGVERFIGGRGGLLLHNSANAAHIRELTTPSAKWLGVYASDINKFSLPHDKLTDLDIKRVHELQNDPRYEEKLWKDELDCFLKYKKKAEQEAFSRYGLTYS